MYPTGQSQALPPLALWKKKDVSYVEAILESASRVILTT